MTPNRANSGTAPLPRLSPPGGSGGFSLPELIIVIVISAILAGILAQFITRPMEGYVDLSRRATLVYDAENALRRMQRDIRRALPNSVRVGAGNGAIEMLSTIDGGRYREDPPGGAFNLLDTTVADSDFDILGNFVNLDMLVPATPVNLPAGARVAVYNIGAVDAVGDPVPGSNAYAAPNASGTNVITPAGTTVAITDSGDEDHINLNPGFQFTYDSPQQRLYVVDTPVMYVCSGGELRRYTGYDFRNDTPPVPPSVPSQLMAQHITGCNFTYQPGTSQRAGVATLELTVSDAGETISLLHQVHVDNLP